MMRIERIAEKLGVKEVARVARFRKALASLASKIGWNLEVKPLEFLYNGGGRVSFPCRIEQGGVLKVVTGTYRCNYACNYACGDSGIEHETWSEADSDWYERTIDYLRQEVDYPPQTKIPEPVPYPGDDALLDEQELSIRTGLMFSKAGIKTLGEARKLTVRQFLTMKNATRRSLKEFNALLLEWGIPPLAKEDNS